jgi:regulator of sigma E protease
MVTGQVSVKNLSGPISIAHYAGESAKLGPARFLEFLALVSVSLGVLNLLPIPLLDGGHLLYYLIEFVTRRPVPESVQIYGQQIGIVMLLSLMGLAVYNDILRIL